MDRKKEAEIHKQIKQRDCFFEENIRIAIDCYKPDGTIDGYMGWLVDEISFINYVHPELVFEDDVMTIYNTLIERKRAYDKINSNSINTDIRES